MIRMSTSILGHFIFNVFLTCCFCFVLHFNSFRTEENIFKKFDTVNSIR